MKTRGQVTIFIIIGIALLIALALFYFLRATSQAPTEPVITSQMTSVQAKAGIEGSIESCLRQLSLDGIEIMRVQAGYINVPDGMQSIDAKERERGAIVSDENIKHVEYGADEANKMPYWLTKEELFVPSLEKMEEDLKVFIEENMLKCLNNFDDYKAKGIEIFYQMPNATVLFQEAVTINMNFPIKAVSNDGTIEVSDFRQAIPVNMAKIHQLASNIAFGEQNEKFLEYFAMDMISKYGFGGFEDSFTVPPIRFTDVNFDCSKATWSLNEVKQRLTKNYYTNYGHVQLINVDYDYPPAGQNALYAYIYAPFPGKFENTEADFFFDPELFFDLSIKPGGSTIEPDESKTTELFMIPSFCIYKYRFKYTMDYPIIVKVTDKASAEIDAENNLVREKGGFIFYFPVWVTICGNQKRECNYRDYSFDKQAVLDLFSADLNIDASNILNAQRSPFCSPEQRKSEEITINVKDEISEEGVSGVSVNYYGGNFENDCTIGETDDEGVLKARFPFCSGCLIYLTKENYTHKFQVFDVDDKTKNATIFMEPQLELNAFVNLVYLPAFMTFWLSHDIDATPASIAMTLGVTDEMSQRSLGKNLSQLEKSDLFAIAPVQMGVVPVESGIEVMIRGDGATTFNYITNATGATISLAPGEYEISTAVNGEVTIMPSTIENPDGTKMTMSLNPAGGTYRGTWMIGSSDGTYTFTKEDIKGKDSIIFYAPVEAMPYEIKDAEDIGAGIIQPDESLMYKNYTVKSEQYSPYFKPAFK